jgi:hypothetical protein
MMGAHQVGGVGGYDDDTVVRTGPCSNRKSFFFFFKYERKVI